MITAVVGASYLGWYAPPPVASGVVIPPVFVSTTELPALMPGVPYHAALVAEGGDPPYAFTVKAGSGPLPPGITLAPDGVFSGTAPAMATMQPATLPPATVDVFYHAPVTVADIAFPFTVRVNDSIGQSDEESYVFYLWRNPTVFSLVSGALPGCLQFGGDGIGGTSMRAGTFPITVRGTDADGRTVTRDYVLTVNSPRIDP